jgi:NADH dehydrogenase
MNRIPRTVLILGGGYAGVLCANRLRSSLTGAEAAHTRIALVNPSDMFFERIRLHELAAGSRQSVATPLAQLLHPDIELVVGRVLQVDPDAKVVDIKRDDVTMERAFDKLVYAVGSGSASVRVPGAAEHAFQIGDPESATAAATAVRSGAAGQRIVVVGGGFTGVETAGEVAEQHPDAVVTLVAAGGLVASMRPAARSAIREKLERLRVHILEQPRVRAVAAQRLTFADGSGLDFDVCLWAAGFAVPQLAAESGLACDEIGRLRVDAQLRSIDAPDIFGAGDAVRLPASNGRHLRMGCAVALPLGGAAAESVLADLRAQPAPTASVGYLVQCISIGRRDGYVQVVHPDDRPRRLALTGRVAAIVKESICRMTVSGPRNAARKPGAYWAPKGPKAPAATPTAEAAVR